MSGFGAASAVEPDGPGRYRVLLDDEWTVGHKLHGGYLQAIATRAASVEAARLATATDGAPVDPVAVSAQYLRAPRPGPAVVRVAALKTGRTVSVLRAVIEQDGVDQLEATVTTGRLDDSEPLWADPVGTSPTPDEHAVNIAATPGGAIFRLSENCEVYLDPQNAAFLSGAHGPLALRLWVRPKGEDADLPFALLAGDVSMPTTFNLGMFGWTPTVQLTALLRGHPAPGWLAVDVRTRLVRGGWLDEDATVTDSAGRIVCQARQLALIPR